MYIYFTPTTLFICTFIFRQTTTPSCVSCVCGLHYRKLLESSEDVKKKVIENFNETTFEADHYYELFRDGTVKLQHDLNLYATWLEKWVARQK